MVTTTVQVRKQGGNAPVTISQGLVLLQRSQERCNGHSCCSTTSVAVPGLFNPLLHEGDLHGSSLLYRLGVQRVPAA